MERKVVIGFLVILSAVSIRLRGTAQTADCIAAEVNSQVITLSDLRIVRAFGLAGTASDGDKSTSLFDFLRQLIDRKIVLELAQEKMPVAKQETDSFLEAAVRGMGRETYSASLKEFGLDEEDLRVYIEEKIRFDKIISMRFSQSVLVSLKEIEDYYAGTYLPARQKEGQTARPMIQVVKDIEKIIQEDKIRIQIASWILNLKKQAEIRIHQDCLKNNESVSLLHESLPRRHRNMRLLRLRRNDELQFPGLRSGPNISSAAKLAGLVAGGGSGLVYSGRS